MERKRLVSLSWHYVHVVVAANATNAYNIYCSPIPRLGSDKAVEKINALGGNSKTIMVSTYR